MTSYRRCADPDWRVRQEAAIALGQFAGRFRNGAARFAW